MTTDLCCALCGVGFRNFRIGSKLRGPLRRRDRQLAKRQKLRKQGKVYADLSENEFSGGEDGDDRVSDKAVRVRRLEDGCQPEDAYMQTEERDHEIEEEDEIDGTAGYDPRLLGRADLRWLREVYCLGCHRNSPDEQRKTFWIGPGQVLDHGEIEVEVRDEDDENRPDRTIFKCYDNTDFKSVIPFHDACYEVLRQRLIVETGSPKLNQELLFGVMMELCRDDHAALVLSYGPEIEASQRESWKSIPGSEYCTADPMESLYLLDNLLHAADPDDGKEISNKPSRQLLMQALQVRSDPFSRLPRELTTNICRYLQPLELFGFMVSSPWARLATMHNSFWKESIYQHFPWFWEYTEYYNKGQLPKTLDYTALHQVLMGTAGGRHLDDRDLMALGNRVRIWKISSPIVQVYLQNMKQLSGTHICRPTLPADCLPDLTLPMTAVAHPQPAQGLRTGAIIWVPHWGDMHHFSAEFVIYRNATRDLVGMAVIRDGEQYPLGTCPEVPAGSMKILREAASIRQGDWIDRLLLHIPTEHRFSNVDQATAVKGVTVFTRMGRCLTLGDGNPSYSVKQLIPKKRCALIGLQGQQAADGTLIRMCTVEALDPYYDDMFPDEDEMIPRNSRPSAAENRFTAHAVWSPEAMSMNIRGAGRCALPIWRHPSVRVRPLQDPPSNEDPLMPWQILQWAHDASELRAVTRISAWVHHEDTVLPETGKKGRVARVLGMTTQYHQRSAAPARHFGMNRRSAQTKDTKFVKKLRHFDLDGRKGEHVVAVGIATTESWSAVEIKTNLDRKVVFGQQGAPITDVKTAADGHMIVGLAAQFVNRPGQKQKPGFEKWMQLSSLALLTKEMSLS